MREAFDFAAPTYVRFGLDRRAELADVLVRGKWGVLATPRTLERLASDVAIARCQERGISLIALGAITPNPRLNDVEAALASAHEHAIVGLVAIGGGSAIDAAKLLAVAYRYGATARETLESLAKVVASPPEQDCPLVVMPTTAGTGAEVSQGAIITDTETGRKTAARGRPLIPTCAIIDPRLTVSLSPTKTSEIGFDIVAHAIETYLSRAATPVTDILARAALDAVPGALVRAARNGEDLEARSTLSMYSWLMGYNLAHSSTCLPHRMQYPVGARTDTSHQLGLAAIYPAWFIAEADAAPSRAREIMTRISASLAQGEVEVSSDVPIAFISEMLAAFNLEVTLSDFGLTANDAPSLAAAVEGRVDLDPIEPTPAVIEQLYRASV